MKMPVPAPAPLLLGVLLLLGAPASGEESEFDVLWLKNGRKLEGVIVSETAEKVVFKTLVKGRKGQTVGTVGVTISRRDIDRIERMGGEARRKALGRSSAFGDRRQRLADALAKIKPEPARFLGRDGLHTVGRHFEVFSTCEEQFVKEVTHYLDEVFEAYKQSFRIRRNADRKVRVLLLADFDEYRRFQKKLFGRSFQNAAFYHKGENYIAAFDMVQQEEAERIRREILDLEKKIRDGKRKIREFKSDLRKEALDIHRKVVAEANRVRKLILNDSGRDKTERLRRVDQWEKDRLALLEEEKKDAKKRLDDFRREADEAIEHNREIIAENRLQLSRQNREMYEMLFHEGFHAFALNFLWQADESGGVPRWLDEGLACYYEMSAVELGELIHGASHPFLLSLLEQAVKEAKLLPLEEILGGDAVQFLVAHRSDADRSNLHYAQSWAIVHYMVDRVPRDRVEAYVAVLLAGRDGVKAFETMMGRSIREVEAEIREHIEGLR